MSDHPAQLAALSFQQQGRFLIVTINDPNADPARYRKEFRRHGLDVDLRMQTTGPNLAGQIIFLENNTKDPVSLLPSRCHNGVGTCYYSAKIPLIDKYKRDFVRMIFGRLRR